MNFVQILSGSRTVPNGITTFLSALLNFKIRKIISPTVQTLASGNYDSGGTSDINPPKP
jgi:hypothetical protein